MNPELIEKVTRLVVEKLQSQHDAVDQAQYSSTGVKFWDHTSNQSKEKSMSPSVIVETDKQDAGELIKIKSYQRTKDSKRLRRINPVNLKWTPLVKGAGLTILLIQLNCSP